MTFKHLIGPILYRVGILTEFDHAPPGQKDHRKKDGVIVLIVSVAMVGIL